MVKTQKPKPPKHWEEVEHPVLSTRGAGRVDEDAHVETLIDALGKSQGFSWFRRTEVMGTLWPIHHLNSLNSPTKNWFDGKSYWYPNDS